MLCSEEMQVQDVIIYVDGACSGNPGPGGWAAILNYSNVYKTLSSYLDHSTNNRMLLTSINEALKKLTQPCSVSIFTNSAYIINSFEQGWINNWKNNNWRKTNGAAVEHQDLWKELLKLMDNHRVNFCKESSNHLYMRECDRLAKLAVKEKCELKFQ